jgi:hypothetical protein
MYRVPAATDLLSQGDIFRGPFVFPYTEDLAEEIQLVRNEEVLPLSGVGDAWQEPDSVEVILSAAIRCDFAIVLSQSCDAENNQKPPLEFVAMGGIRPITVISAGNRDNCRSNKMVRYHHIPERGGIGLVESFVHFGLLALVNQQSLAAFKASRVLALEYPYREDLGHRFGEFFSRVALP